MSEPQEFTEWPEKSGPWVDDEIFTGRERSEIAFSRLYARAYHHGTDGHNSKVIVNKMAGMLDTLHQHLLKVEEELESAYDEIEALNGERERVEHGT